MRAFIFPGQGSQSVGMGLALSQASAAAREVFQEVDDALGQKLFKLMTEGPEGDLLLTENAQPAIMAHAIAVLRVLEKEGGVRLADKADFVAGHSLGEYTALCAAGALDLSTTARLLKLRAGGRCRRRCRWARGRWPRCSVPIWSRRRRLPTQRPTVKYAPSRMTMIRRRW
jgi:[acyl-carrier-protein] S-malonyltransferase